MQDASTIEWLDPWDALGPEKRASFERELQKELMEGHPLYGVAATAIARSQVRDDVLFALHGHVHPYAVVHLVWQGPQRPPWPDTVLYGSLEDWAKRQLGEPGQGLDEAAPRAVQRGWLTATGTWEWMSSTTS